MGTESPGCKESRSPRRRKLRQSVLPFAISHAKRQSALTPKSSEHRDSSTCSAVPPSEGAKTALTLPPSLPKSIEIERLDLPGCDVFIVQNWCSSQLLKTTFNTLQHDPRWEKGTLRLFGKDCLEKRCTLSFSLPVTESRSTAARVNSAFAEPVPAEEDAVVSYRYSGRTVTGFQAPDCVLQLRSAIENALIALPALHSYFPTEALSNATKLGWFSFVLANYYQDGSSTLGMHSDDERSLEGPIVSGKSNKCFWEEIQNMQQFADDIHCLVSLGATRTFVFTGRKNGPYQKSTREVLLRSGMMMVMAGKTQKLYKHGIPPTKSVVGGRISLTFRRVVQTK